MTLLLGLDIGGTKSAAVVGDGDGNVLARISAPTPRESSAEAVTLFCDMARAVCRKQGVAVADMAALGVSYGGPIHSAAGLVLTPPNLHDWKPMPLKALLETEFGLPVQVENDANATALAEHRWGAGRGCRDMAFLTMGTGIGAGLILDGRLYRGRRDLAGEVGHAVVLPNGPLCPCGKRGCLEALASGTSLGRMGAERSGEAGLTALEVCARARSGDKTAQGIIAEAAFYMGVGLANLLHTLNLERIVLGTLAVHAADLLLDPIRASAQAHCWPSVWEGISIVPAALGDAAQDTAALAVALPPKI